MMVLLLVLLGLTLLLLFRKVFRPGRWKNNVPPSVPGTLPIFGDALTVQKSVHVFNALEQIAREIGPVFRLRLLHKELVVLSSYDVIKEAHNNPLLDKRPDNIVLTLLYAGSMKQKGIIFNNTDEWKTLRRFTLKTLRNFGFGKVEFEDGILEECQSLIDFFEVEGLNRVEVPINTIFNKAALNVVWKTIAGQRYDYDDDRLDTLITMLEKFINFAQSLLSGPLGLLPFLRHIPPFKSGFLKSKREMDELRLFMKETVDEHKKSFDKDNIRDYIDTFINEIEISEDKTFCEEQMVICCLDLFAGGSETTSRSLMFFFAYMILYPDIQEKVSVELLAVAPDRHIRMEDSSALPFTNAVLTEIWRLNPIIPNDPQRESLEDVKIGGFDIPAGTEILSNYFAAQTDEAIWDEPTVFKPERHLGQKENLLLFGTGRRKCLGEGLARAENLLIFCNLIKHFKFESSEENKPSVNHLDCLPGLTIGPKPFKVIVTPRQEVKISNGNDYLVTNL